MACIFLFIFRRRFELGEENTGADGSWRYDVTSHESMAGDWLFGINVNHGKITVRTVEPDRVYTIHSDFVTESFWGLIISESCPGNYYSLLISIFILISLATAYYREVY